MNSYLASLGPALANHLWQSTAFGLLAWLLTLALRRNQAHMRYAVWLAASIKFLVPFSLLVSAGHLLPHPKQPLAPVVYSAMDVVEEPFAMDSRQVVAAPVPISTVRERVEAVLPAALGTLWLLGFGAVLFAWGNRWREVARSARQAVPATQGRELEILRKLGGGGLPLLMSTERMEPGVFGIFRPVLIWPAQLSVELDDHHIEAIVAHELTHIRRRDNLTALLHMLVEAALWFHPLVWWIERQMVKEREQACDEAVVAMGGSAETYAESLLKTCWFCIESPLPCVSGVTGADLKRRVADIVTGQTLLRMTWPKKMLLTTAVVGALVVPVVFGQAKAAEQLIRAAINVVPKPMAAAARPVSDQTIELPPAQPTCVAPSANVVDVASIKPSQKEPGDTDIDGAPDGLTLSASVFHMIGAAYDLRDFQITGRPAWFTTAVWDIAAKVDQPPANYTSLGSEARNSILRQRIQSILTQRFALRCHFETKELPVYNLVLAKGGSKLKSTPAGSVKKGGIHGGLSGGQHHIDFSGIAMSDLVRVISSNTGRIVIDKTGVTGLHDFTLDWAYEHGADASAQSPGPTIFTALQEQLGFKLESAKGPVPVLVVDRIEKPTVDGAELPMGDQSKPTGDQATIPVPLEARESYHPALSFEAATIKPSPPGDNSDGMEGDGQRFKIRNAYMAYLIGYAYNLPEKQLVGGPAWMTTDKYDIDAVTTLTKPTSPQFREMLRSLLAERFHLSFHHAQKELPVYLLSLAKGGPRLTASKPDERGVSFLGRGMGHLEVSNGDTEELARWFSGGIMDRPVVDKTGVKGQFDFTLNWMPDGSQYSGMGSRIRPPSDGSEPLPGIFTAIQEQLGLKLEPAKSQVDVIEIDQLDWPTEN